MSQPLTEFLNWVDTLIPHDKAKVFKSIFRFPVKTNELTGIIYDKLSRVFDGRNPAFNYQFITSEQRDDWEWYRQEMLDEPNVWQTKGWEFFKNEINSVLIVDLPREQKGDVPEPYFYWLPICKVLAYEVADKEKGQMEWIIFKTGDGKIAVFDDEFYRIFPDKKEAELTEPEVEVPHDLGYCPARFFWDMPLILDEPDIKYHPISRELSELDWYLFFHISKKTVDLSGAYPVYWGLEQDCDYSNEKNGDYCDGGFIRDDKGQYKFDLVTNALMKCPKCGEKRLTGAGSFIEVPVPEKDGVDLRNPVGKLDIDKSSLDYNVEEVTRLKEEIIDSVCGSSSEIVNDQAINAKQVGASFENPNTVLNRIKKGFENAQNWVDETVCRLRYSTLFVSANINMGTEFYNLTPEELRKQYKEAKDAGASESELDAMQNQILETTYRNNPIMLQRMMILAELEPYRHFSRAEVMDLSAKGLIDEEMLRIKLNFSTFVRRFERENTNIIEFGSEIPFERKIQVITDKFKEYANEAKPVEKPEPKPVE